MQSMRETKETHRPTHPNAAAIVLNLEKLEATILDRDVDGRGPGVQAVLNQLLESIGRPVDDLRAREVDVLKSRSVPDKPLCQNSARHWENAKTQENGLATGIRPAHIRMRTRYKRSDVTRPP